MTSKQTKAAAGIPEQHIDHAAAPQGQALQGERSETFEHAQTAQAVNAGVSTFARPAATIDTVRDEFGLHKGPLESGAHTDDSRPKISGKGEPGVWVHVYDGNEVMGRVEVGANGEWSFSPTLPLKGGEHQLSVTHQYPSGELVVGTETYVIFVDKVAPDMPVVLGIVDDEGRITDPITHGSVTDDNLPTIEGKTEPFATIIIYDKDVELDRVQADENGDWRYTPKTELADGLHILNFEAMDRSGNVSEDTRKIEFTVDARPEMIKIFGAEDNVGPVTDDLVSGGKTDDTKPKFFGNATAGGIVKIYEGDVVIGEVVAGVDGHWEYTPTEAMSEGLHTLHATVTLPAKGESPPSKPFNLTVVEGPGAPTITSIPEAASIYTSTLAQNGSEMTVSLTGTGAKVGDMIHIQWGTSTFDQVLTQVNITTGSVTLNVPAAVTHSTASYAYDFAVTAQIIGKDGAFGAVSKPYDVVGTYTRALVSDTLQLAPANNVYTGTGVTVTTTGTMAKTAQTPGSLAGLTLSDSLQANATFTLSNPADQITLRLSGADNALGAKIHVYDVNGNLMFEQTVFGDATARHLATFTWTKTGLADIGSFTVTSMSASVTLDAFSQYAVTHTKDTRDPNLIDVLTETFYGSGGSDVVSMSQYAQSYFAQATAAVHGGSGIDTLKLVGASHVLDLTAAGSKISSTEIIDISGAGINTLTLNLSDVLRNGGVDVFHTGDKSRVQMMVKGNAGDKVNLSDLLTGNVDHGDWVKKTAVVIDGATYDSYQHSSLGAELLVQQGVTVTVTNSTITGVNNLFGALSEMPARGESDRSKPFVLNVDTKLPEKPNRTEFRVERFSMMQRWADYLDELRHGADVVKLRAA